MGYPHRVPRAQDQLPSRFRRALLYVVEQLGAVNVTKLQKILYLADLEHFHETGTTLTGARWIRYTHGPMAKALIPSRDLMDGHELEVSTEPRGAFEANVYRPGPSPRFGPDLAAEERATIDRVLALMGPMSTKETVALAYNTSPMRLIVAVERGSGGAVMLGTDLQFDIELAALAEAVGGELTVALERRGAFKRAEVSRIADLQDAALNLGG
jgi:Protein of unknown function (DUF4065)